MQVIRRTTVNTSADKLWAILGDDFNNVSEWASIVADSQANPDLAPDEMGRVCVLENGGHVVETVHNYDDNNRELSFYLESSKMPFFMKEIDNTWSVKPLGPDLAELQVQVDIAVMPVFKQLMSSMLKKGLNKQADSLLGELKYYAEHGHAQNAAPQVATA